MRKTIPLIILTVFLLSGCIQMDDSKSLGIIDFLFPTEGALVKDDGSLEFTTTIEDNRFSYVVLQLYTDVPYKHISDINKSGEGKQSGLYMHKLETGTYTITLKGNSNKKDEGVSARVFLINGRSYTYVYDVREFSEKFITIDNYKFKLN